MITPDDGKAEMPKDKPPLAEAEIDLIRRWIAEGAVDDTPANAAQPLRHGPPAGLHAARRSSRRSTSRPTASCSPSPASTRCCCCKADGSGLVARLVGLSERIESVAFSPDGKRLAVTGGLPGRMGEVQVWDVAKQKLAALGPRHLRHASTARAGRPTARRSPSAAPTTRVRAIDAATGEQVLFMGSHNDWVLDTVFSADGSHLVSVGRDMTAKLTEVATQRFVDNITSITPGALKGGIAGRRPAPEARRDRRRRLRRRAQGLPRLPPDRPRHRRRLQPDPRAARR